MWNFNDFLMFVVSPVCWWIIRKQNVLCLLQTFCAWWRLRRFLGSAAYNHDVSVVEGKDHCIQVEFSGFSGFFCVVRVGLEGTSSHWRGGGHPSARSGSSESFLLAADARWGPPRCQATLTWWGGLPTGAWPLWGPGAWQLNSLMKLLNSFFFFEI